MKSFSSSSAVEKIQQSQQVVQESSSVKNVTSSSKVSEQVMRSEESVEQIEQGRMDIDFGMGADQEIMIKCLVNDGANAQSIGDNSLVINLVKEQLANMGLSNAPMNLKIKLNLDEGNAQNIQILQDDNGGQHVIIQEGSEPEGTFDILIPVEGNGKDYTGEDFQVVVKVSPTKRYIEVRATRRDGQENVLKELDKTIPIPDDVDVHKISAYMTAESNRINFRMARMEPQQLNTAQQATQFVKVTEQQVFSGWSRFGDFLPHETQVIFI